MPRFVMSLLIFLFLFGCGPRYVDFFPYHDNGVKKPHVVFIPVINSCQLNLPWDISKELTQNVRNEIRNNGNLYLFSECEVENWCLNSSNTLFFGNDLSFATRLPNSDFIVVTELIEHDLSPYKGQTLSPSSFASMILSIKVRMRIIDIRECEPKVILQEIIVSQHLIPKRNINEGVEYSNLSFTPYRQAYKELIYKLVNRIESVTYYAR